VVSDSKNELAEAQIVEDKWNAVKEVWLKAADQACGWTEGLPRHRETW